TAECDQFSKLMDRYFSETNAKNNDIAYVVYTRGNSLACGDPWSREDIPCINVPYWLQDRYGLRAQVFNVEQECCGSIIAIRLLQSLLPPSSEAKALILSSNFFEGTERRLMGDMILVSDAIGLMEARSAGVGLEFIDHVGMTDGRISRVIDFNESVNF